MRDLPRQLTADELAELFEGRSALVERLARQDDPLGSAREVIAGLTEGEKLEALNAHPAIGARGDFLGRPMVLVGISLSSHRYRRKFSLTSRIPTGTGLAVPVPEDFIVKRRFCAALLFVAGLFGTGALQAESVAVRHAEGVVRHADVTLRNVRVNGESIRPAD